MQEQGNISIHTENIFPIIKKSLYSDREIFLRELVSNAVDAINKLKWLSYKEDFDGTVPEPKIKIEIDKEKRQLKISDTGIGMTAEEVKKYINQVAFSSAEEFLEKYKTTGDKQAIIGHFGLGFYSSFMVSSLVEIETKSCQKDSQAVHWSCDGSTQFTLSDDTKREETGTTIILTLTKEDDEFLEPSRIKHLILKYCDFLPVPIEFEGEVVNKQEPLWVKSPSEIEDKEYLEFYKYLFPYQEDPLFWIHIHTEYPVVVKGILYFPKMRANVAPNEGQIKLYCDQVYVTDHAEEIIPKFLVPLRGTIEVDGNDIPLNVSRSYLHNDRKVKRISDHIAKKVGDRLNDMYRDNYERYLEVWPHISMFMKFGALNSDKFYQKIKDILIFKTLRKEEEKSSHVTLADYLERNKEKQENTVYYASDEAVHRTYIDLHKNQGLEVLILDELIDTHLISFLERENQDTKFKRVDSELDEKLLQEDNESKLVDPNTQKTKSETLTELFQSVLGKEKLTIKTQSLGADAVPAMVLFPENQRRMQEISALFQQDLSALQLPEEHILVINSAHPLISHIQSIAKGQVIGGNNELPKLLCQHVYDLALMAQKSLDPKVIQSFVSRSNEVMTRLAEKALS